MGWASEERQRQVRFLNTLARSCQLACVKVNSGRARVRSLFEAIGGSGASADVKRQAAGYHAAYEATFSDPAPANAPAAVPAPVAAVEHKRALRGSSFLLTYNWDFFGLVSVRPGPSARLPGAGDKGHRRRY